MGKELLLEIGTEEIPAAFLPQAMKDMEAMIGKAFEAAMLGHGPVMTMATPRRLVLSVKDLAERQEDCVVEKLGPARRAAFDEQGAPTAAAKGFAKSQGVTIDALETKVTEKGEYLIARKQIIGEATKKLLPQIIGNFINTIPFRKSMRWGEFDHTFARPIHWILAIFGGEVIPFNLGDIVSSNKSRGHRFLKPDSFTVTNLEDYLTQTREHFVIADPEERRRIILKGAEEAARALGGKAFYNQDLLDTVTYLVEYPTVISGTFDAGYLSLPKEVLATSMMNHQKYFPVMDDRGNLLPHFLTVVNGKPRDPAVVRKGNEKVIRARLADAQFFFKEDSAAPLEKRVEDLRGVVFHTLLGTSYEKVMRFRTLAGDIAALLDPSLTERVLRVATLAKADLTTQMVGEFPELQGIMGREYALLAGEDERVAKGIYEHYLPTGAAGDLPETPEGALVSIADKMDSLAAFFGVNLIPTGTADPYALRRQALGIINIILDRQYLLRLDDLTDKSLALLTDRLKRPAGEARADILAFFKARFENLLISQGHLYDVVDAVLATDAADVVASMKKITAIEELKHDPDFLALATAFKRVVNIVKDFPGGMVDERLFESDGEQSLYSAYKEIREKATGLIKTGNYSLALREIARLRPTVDVFFNAVLVMAEDEAIRNNRLSLLAAISSIFREVADFSRLVTLS